MTSAELVAEFERYVARSIDEQGCFPYPCLSLAADGVLCFAAVAVSPEASVRYFWDLITKGATEVIFGLDHYTKPGQGTEFADVVSVIHWKGILGPTFQSQRRIGVINYQHSPRVVRPIDWNNRHWTVVMTRMAMKYAPDSWLAEQEQTA